MTDRLSGKARIVLAELVARPVGFRTAAEIASRVWMTPIQTSVQLIQLVDAGLVEASLSGAGATTRVYQLRHDRVERARDLVGARLVGPAGLPRRRLALRPALPAVDADGQGGTVEVWTLAGIREAVERGGLSPRVLEMAEAAVNTPENTAR